MHHSMKSKMETNVGEEPPTRLLIVSLEHHAKTVEMYLRGLYKPKQNLLTIEDGRETTTFMGIFLSYFDEDEDDVLNFGEYWSALASYMRFHLFRHFFNRNPLDRRPVGNALIINDIEKLESYLNAHHLTFLLFYISNPKCEILEPTWQAYADSVKESSTGVVKVDVSIDNRIQRKFRVDKIPSTVLIVKGIAHTIYPSYTMFKYEGRFAENALGAFADGEYCFHGAFTYTVLYIVYVYITISCRRKYRAHTHTTPKLKSNVRGKRVNEGSTDVCVDVCLKI